MHWTDEELACIESGVSSKTIQDRLAAIGKHRELHQIRQKCKRMGIKLHRGDVLTQEQIDK